MESYLYLLVVRLRINRSTEADVVGYAFKVGTKVALMVCLAARAGLKVHVTVIGVVPDASLLIQPETLFPARKKVTLPETETATLIVAETPFDNGSGTESETEMGEDELLVIVRVVSAAISVPA